MTAVNINTKPHIGSLVFVCLEILEYSNSSIELSLSASISSKGIEGMTGSELPRGSLLSIKGPLERHPEKNSKHIKGKNLMFFCSV